MIGLSPPVLMRAVRRTAKGVEVVDVERPLGQGIRVRVVSSGICGTDVANARRGPIAVTLGHEFAGYTDDDRLVAVEPIVTCGRCEECLRNSYHLCQGSAHGWIGGTVDGGMAEEVVVPEQAVVELPTSVDPFDASLVEPLAGALHGLRLAGRAPGRRVAVIGGGSMGLCTVVAAQGWASDVSLSARYAHQMRAGQSLGASAVTGTYDIVVDAAGTEEALGTASELVMPGGTICALAKYQTPHLPISPSVMMHKELTVVSPVAYCRSAQGRDIDDAAVLVGRRPDLPRALITHRFSLAQGAEAFVVAGDRASGSIKVVIHP